MNNTKRKKVMLKELLNDKKEISMNENFKNLYRTLNNELKKLDKNPNEFFEKVDNINTIISNLIMSSETLKKHIKNNSKHLIH